MLEGAYKPTLVYDKASGRLRWMTVIARRLK